MVLSGESAAKDVVDLLDETAHTQEEAIAAVRHALRNGLGSAMERALALVEKATTSGAERGRLVVSGVGKSGLIARKIAATLASTGTPSQFVHAGEASHGDMGMVTREDVLLLLSNSGETAELRDLLVYSKRFSIPVIAITGSPASTLSEMSDVALVYPNVREACPLRLAPTTSTLQQLVIGDMLAIALMRDGFSASDFGLFHPGGKLGAQLVTVDGLMATGDALPLVAEHAPMSDALVEMSRKGFGVAGTVDADGHLTGIITDGDLRRSMEGLLDRRANEVATRDPQTIEPEQLAQEALAVMNERKITCLFVTAPGDTTPLGILHVHDCLRAGVDGG